MGESTNNLWMFIYISIPMSIVYSINGFVLRNRKVQIIIENVFFRPLGLEERKKEWKGDIIGRINALINAVLSFTAALFILLTNEEFYSRVNFFACDWRGDVCLAMGFGFYTYHSIFVVFPGFRKYPLHVPHHILAMLCIFLIVRDQTYQMGMLMAFTTEVANPFALMVGILREFEMGGRKVFIVNGILLWVTWTIGRVFGILLLLYCQYLNWEDLSTRLSFTMKVVMNLGTSFAVFVNFWWYYKICRGLASKLFVRKSVKRDDCKQK